MLYAQAMSWGMNALGVSSSEDALTAIGEAAARGAAYELVVVDDALPAGGAIELAKSIKAHATSSKSQVVMLMSVGRHRSAAEAREAGVALCISKPVRQSALYSGLAGVVTGSGESASDAAAIAVPTPVVKRENRGTLLLAEDNVVNQQVALAILKIEGYKVTIANNGREAVEAYRNGTFDLVLMDCHMPEMDGFEAARAIRTLQKEESRARTPIVALTANAMQQDRDECLKSGMDDHLSKPYTRLQIRAMLEKWLPIEDGAVTAKAA
jgi:CheY-like chemotaxis protein